MEDVTVPLNQFTVGVELEMILVSNYGKFKNKNEYKFIEQTLQPLAECFRTEVINTAYNVETERRMAKPENYARVDAAFHIQEEATIDYDEDGERSAEVATPILRHDNWEECILGMFKALTTNPRFGLRFNTSTGLHIHIGLEGGYSLEELKRISKAIILFEKQMDIYHPQRLVARSVNEVYFMSNRYNKTFKNLSDLQCMEVIDGATSDICLFQKINCNPINDPNRLAVRKYKYNFLSAYGTVEFRQAMATSSEIVTIKWIQSVISFIKAAIETSDQQFGTWATDGVNDPAVFEKFGCPPSVV